MAKSLLALLAVLWPSAAIHNLRPSGELPHDELEIPITIARGSASDPQELRIVAAKKGKSADESWKWMREEGVWRPEQSHEVEHTGHTWSLVGVIALLLVALSPVLYTQGLKAFLSVLMYIVSICFVKVFAKQAFVAGFHFPYTLTAMHMLTTAIVASLIDRPLMGEAVSTMNIAVVKAVSLGLNNSALFFGTAAFVSIIGALTPCTTYALDVVRTRRMPLFKTLAILIACLGACVSTSGELKFSLLALFLSLGACFARSLKTVWSYDLLEANVGVYRLAAWSSIWSFLIMIIIGLSLEHLAPYRKLVDLNAEGLTGVVVSCACAAVLNILQCFVLKFLGPVLQNLFGSLELVAVIVLAIILLGEKITKLEWIGVLLVCVGCGAVKAEGAIRAVTAKMLNQLPGGAKKDSDF
mmetsp:Transcript_55811/g.149416  ORF Transcript_55811/g.149416 Transcript_55811/m.149416 type:complete len:412 (-) Transcript_55811:85-1320(-)|eukprot:CAMPEP_0171189130 /NCGR_PEP_ID=MMETSP0790-20130122/18187_1 /TAXON_ID=2925 /ORGANISM="Alexandrium catenella, Strain OF101" /LENGTH=411 /DNA_ID=CAMNT_0011654231 /DNA_START=82 /DNA_END=1317 /DNA_ORIENTATION=-